MRFDEKARENLEAIELLLNGGSMPLHNAASSRAYYAAYLAVADRAQAHGIPFDSRENNYYRHDRLPRLAFGSRILDADSCDDLEWLYGQRVKADYWEDQVSHDEAFEAAEVAARLVTSLVPAEER